MATIWIDGVPLSVAAGTALNTVLSHTPHPCGGMGVCGKCRVGAVGALSPLSTAEERHLTPTEIAAGIRLSCCVTVEGDCRVTTATPQELSVLTDGQSIVVADPVFSAYGVVVDVGTTTLAARLYTSDGALLACAGSANPQAPFGADVLSRLQSAREGQDLTTPLQCAVNGLVERLAALAGISVSAVDGVAITGNTAMLSLLTATDASTLMRAPFSLPPRMPTALTACQIGLIALLPNTAVYLSPCASAFIGGDALCAALACGMDDTTRPTLLGDMGTNGEWLLRCGERLFACSTAAGPAFEGVGISCGMPATVGAIDGVSVVNHRLEAHVIGNRAAAGICGSGLVDAAACLLAMEEMDTTGSLDGECVSVADGVTLTQEDMRALQQAKSAIYAGLQTLLHRAAVSADAVEEVYVAGGFGSRLNGHHAAAIGLLPSALATRIHSVGNAALDGAAQMLLNGDALATLTAMATKVQTVELSTDPYFAELFIKNMSF